METFNLANARVHRRRLLSGGRPSIATVRVVADGIEIGERTIPRTAIEEATVIPRSGGAAVRLRVNGEGITDIDVPDSSTGGDLLRALRLGAGTAAVTFKVDSSMFSGGVYLLLIIAALFLTVFVTGLLAKTLGPAVVAIPIAGVAGIIRFMVSKARLKVGADGVLLEWFTRRRFFPHSEIDEVSVADERGPKDTRLVHVVLRQGSSCVRIPVRRMGSGDRQLADAIAERIEAERTASAGADGGSSLDQGGRSARAWIDHLRTVGTGAAAGVRRAAMPIERLLGVFDDATQPRRVRLAAAIAASGSGNEAALARIREVAAAAASPKFRLALEAAADPERDVELEALIDEVEEDGPEVPRGWYEAGVSTQHQ